MDLSADTQDHLSKVRKWLDENVTVIDSVRTLEIKNITFTVAEYSGAFDADINGIELPFTFSEDNPTGRIIVAPPPNHQVFDPNPNTANGSVFGGQVRPILP